MKSWNHHSLLLSMLAVFCASTGQADGIDPNKPISASLKPHILYFNFDEGAEATLSSQGEFPLSASVEPGKTGANPIWRPGRNPLFGKAVEFNYGERASFAEGNEEIAGNHLSIPDNAALQLVGQSFTLGAWVQIPENAEIPERAYKKILGKGAYSESYPGWALQISSRDSVWVMTFLLADVGSPLARITARLPGGLEPGAWHHLAVAFDAEAEKIVLWFDGTSIHTQDATGSIGESTVPLFIGENGMSLYCNIPLTIDEVFIVSGAHDLHPVEK